MRPVRNVKTIIEYDGTDFFGFQKQPSVRTVQGELESTLEGLFGERVQVIGAGRTDAGVHATGQVISFRVPGPIPTDNICTVLNDRLPCDVRARRCEDVPESFHARRSAKARTYVYTVLNRAEPSAILGRYTWHITELLDVESIAAAAAQFVGTKDFASFGMAERAGGSTVRHIVGFTIHRQREAVFFNIKANAFLRGMARAIVGTVVEVGQGRRRAAEIAEILAARDRQAGGVTAPPQGLCLTKVEY